MNMIVRPLALALFLAVPLMAVAQVQGGNGWRPPTGSQGSNMEAGEQPAPLHGGNGWRPPAGFQGGNGVAGEPSAAQQGDNGEGTGRRVARSIGGNALRCSVTDFHTFDGFIAGKPTPVEFVAAYSCVTLVLPGDFASRELRPDNSRYFADLDAHGRIVGGYFQ
ncbi:hypothetical protein [Luteibacter yeojuensis]|uniref:Uncharacterized protein n=1 Tax=Luteibacter yeojuensis TaxID=345309 RepID=A0A7X5TQI5_9GAMM|nr:hypothetical protein [Luteibacter yeojuensis]NID16591.1 hypothetical protein [Luteibacter yeojuensis]